METCSSCAYCKDETKCTNERSYRYHDTVTHNETCIQWVGREDDGFVTILEEKEQK